MSRPFVVRTMRRTTCVESLAWRFKERLFAVLICPWERTPARSVTGPESRGNSCVPRSRSPARRNFIYLKLHVRSLFRSGLRLEDVARGVAAAEGHPAPLAYHAVVV